MSGRGRRRLAALLVAGLAACSRGAPSHAPPPEVEEQPLEVVAPEAEGFDSGRLAALTDWVKANDLPIFSILVSRDGRLVYELYTSRLPRDAAHYLMSATKSFTSALVGIAIDAHALPGPETPVSKLFPARLFPDDAARARFDAVTLKDVLGMSALDAQVPPHLVSPETRARQKAFLAADNRAEFALTQALLPEPGKSYEYTDVTPLLATGALEYATHETAFEFAAEHLFEPLGFRNAEWMHEDAAGLDNGAYGLRVRPVDMQKFGMLFLNGGVFRGRRVVSQAWVDASFTPWIRSPAATEGPDYGGYWWQMRFGRWLAHLARGWKGQRIAVVPEARVVVTMTAAMEKGEAPAFQEVMRLVQASLTADPGALPPNPDATARLAAGLREAHELSRIPKDVEARMIPSVEPKERHHPFKG